MTPSYSSLTTSRHMSKLEGVIMMRVSGTAVTPILVVAITLLLLLVPAAAVFASPWSIEIRKWQATQFEDVGQTDSASIKRHQFGISYNWSRQRADIGLTYGYQPVLIRAGNPAHNGYFHQVDLRFRLDYGRTQVEFTTGIHGSSNMFRRFDFIDNALVSTFSVMHDVRDDSARVGINGDYRFGHFRLYPRVLISKVLTGGGELIIDLPVALRWQKNRWQIDIKRYGEKWAALDAAKKTRSAFYMSEWRLGVRWQAPLSENKVTFELGAGISFNSWVRYLDLVRGWQEKDLEPAAFIVLGMKLGSE